MRVTKKHIGEKYKRLLTLLGKRQAQSIVDVGGYRLVHNQYYGWNIEEIINDSGGIDHPFGNLNLSGHEMYLALNLACYALQIKEKEQ